MLHFTAAGSRAAQWTCDQCRASRSLSRQQVPSCSPACTARSLAEHLRPRDGLSAHQLRHAARHVSGQKNAVTCQAAPDARQDLRRKSERATTRRRPRRPAVPPPLPDQPEVPLRQPHREQEALPAVESVAAELLEPDFPEVAAEQASPSLLQIAEFTDAAGQPAVEAPSAEEAAAAEAAWAQQQEAAGEERRAEVLMDIVNAGAELEDKLRQHREDIDEELLEMLYLRIEAAQRYGETEERLEALVLLWQRLRAEAERNAATPALRLLDRALDLLDSPNPTTDAAQRKQEVMNALTAAFTGPMSLPKNIFGVAQALADGEDVLADDLDEEFVPQQDFVKEVQQLLEATGAETRQLKLEALQQEWSQEEKDAFQQVLQERASATAQVQEVLVAAQEIIL